MEYDAATPVERVHDVKMAMEDGARGKGLGLQSPWLGPWLEGNGGMDPNSRPCNPCLHSPLTTSEQGAASGYILQLEVWDLGAGCPWPHLGIRRRG